MTTSELNRLKQDLHRDLGLSEEFETLAENARPAWARKKGYDVTDEEIGQLAAEEALSDDDLERVAGGWSGDTDGGG